MKDHKKNNVRSFRYSDEVATILQQYNNDFDALVLECFYKLPEVREKVKSEEKRYADLRKQIFDLNSQLRTLQNLRIRIDDLERSVRSVIDRVDLL